MRNMGQVIAYLVGRGRFLEGIWVKFLHIWSVRALLEKNMGKVITYLVGRRLYAWVGYGLKCLYI